jgi:hypothetical protein
MAWRIIKQPNGQYARFSEVVDNFTDYDLTRAEAVELCKSHGLPAGIAEQKVRWSEADPARFRGAMEIVRLIHGEEEAAAMAKLLDGDSIGEVI